MLPLDARFRDENGGVAALRDYLNTRPAIVVLGYYGCSNLCSLVLDGLASALAAIPLRAGRDLEVVAISIAPLETSLDALHRKEALLALDPHRPDVAQWHFLTADDAALARMTAALGYRFAYDGASAQYAHATGIVVVTPEGRVARVLPGLSFDPQRLHAALQAAPEPAQPHDEALAERWLLCFRYDPRTGRYRFAAQSAVQLAALGALLALAAFIVRARLREHRAARHIPERSP
jgi:protein SCO1/2